LKRTPQEEAVDLDQCHTAALAAWFSGNVIRLAFLTLATFSLVFADAGSSTMLAGTAPYCVLFWSITAIQTGSIARNPTHARINYAVILGITTD